MKVLKVVLFLVTKKKKKKKVVLNGTEEEKKYLNNIGIWPAGSARWRKMSGFGLRFFFFFLIIGLD